jgi:hypothetical protein
MQKSSENQKRSQAPAEYMIENTTAARIYDDIDSNIVM